jgi:hypothetical protein
MQRSARADKLLQNQSVHIVSAGVEHEHTSELPWTRDKETLMVGLLTPDAQLRGGVGYCQYVDVA